MNPTRRALAEAVGASLAGYAVAVALEAALIGWVRPTEWELASISDVALAVALGVAVYAWRHLLTTRRALADRERTEVVLQTQLSLAAEIQRRLLPEPPDHNGLACAAALQSAGKIGGDLYDFIETRPGAWIVMVADVSGKGIPAAMVLGSLRSTFRALARQQLEPVQIVTQLSAAFLQEWGGAPYATCIVASFDLPAGTLTYTNAGHPRGMLLGPNGMRYLDRGGPPAGLIAHAQFQQERVPIQTDDICVLVTDGVTEGLEGAPPLEQDLVASRAARTRPADLCETLMARALTGHGPSGDPTWDDDRTVVVVTVRDGASEDVTRTHGLEIAEEATPSAQTA